MGKALICIDYTVDFVANDGKLTCGKPGQAIESKITEITSSFIDEGHLSSLLSIIMKKRTLFIQRQSYFRPIIFVEQRVLNFMDN